MKAALSRLVWLTIVAGCPGNRNGADPTESPTGSEPAPRADSSPVQTPGEQAVDSTHRVVFADRTSHAYLLLVEGQPTAPTRELLQELVRRKLPEENPEVSLLLQLIATDPDRDRGPGREVELDPGATDSADATVGSRKNDLLGLYIDVLETSDDKGDPIIPLPVRTDPILTRGLDRRERAALLERRWAILLRAEYRNQHGVRGLRLLQTITELVADERKALIHDWDTGETMNVAGFSSRRLRTNLGNIADQVVVVPFADPRHGGEHVRLATRGMRRFGAPEVELDGIDRDMATLQKATHLLYGLAFRMVVDAEVHPSGLAVEADDVITVHVRDIQQAYAGREGDVPRCKNCEEMVPVHLVKRPAEPQDPRGHPVVRVVAPRATSDRSDYDQREWVRRTIARILG